MDKRSERLDREISRLRQRIASDQAELALLEKQAAERDALRATRPRFEDMPPRDAALVLLRDTGHPLSRASIHQQLKDGGAKVAVVNPDQAIGAAITIMLTSGTLMPFGDLIGLPEWRDRFPTSSRG